MSCLPSFNHTRYDGPYDPCPECEPLLSDLQRKLLGMDRRDCDREYGFHWQHGRKRVVSRWRLALWFVLRIVGLTTREPTR